MPLLAKKHLPIPTKDVLSWASEGVGFNRNEPLYIDTRDPSITISANEAKDYVKQLVAGFRAAGINPGETVLLHSFNNIYYPILVLGIIGAGCVYTGTNPAYTPSELEHAMRTSSAKFIITEAELLPSITQAAEQVKLPTSSIRILDSTSEQAQTLPSGYASWRELLTHGTKPWLSFDDEHTSKNTTAMLCFSSGTTGLPKAAMISHYNLVAQHTITWESSPRDTPLKRLVYLPMFHVSTAPSTHISPIRSGHIQYIMRRFDVDLVLDYVPKYEIHDLMVVPPMVSAIVGHAMPASEKKERFRTLKQVIGGGAPLGRDMQNRCQALMPEGCFTQIWAMTEVTCYASMFPYGQGDDTGSVGRFLPNLDIKILDDEGNDVTGYGVRGELAVRGPTLIRGYVGVERSKDFDGEGYFRTGDVVWGDAESGKWYVVDRKKELIKVRGFQVSPAELEGVLLQHPGIKDVAVVGVSSPELGTELPRAYVVKKDGLDAGLTEKSVGEWVEGRLAKYKRLEGGVKFVADGEIPKNASGKIQKKVLRELAAREVGAKL